MHSWALSMVYLSVTFMVPMIAPVSPSVRAMSAPSLMDSSSVDRVIGIGQNRPVALLHAPPPPLPVGLGHEAGERGEAADAHHDEVAGFARRHLHLRERAG